MGRHLPNANTNTTTTPGSDSGWGSCGKSLSMAYFDLHFFVLTIFENANTYILVNYMTESLVPSYCRKSPPSRGEFNYPHCATRRDNLTRHIRPGRCTRKRTTEDDALHAIVVKRYGNILCYVFASVKMPLPTTCKT